MKKIKEPLDIGNPSNNKINMIQNRFWASSVVFNESTLWIVGGLDKNDTALSTTEFISVDRGSTLGPELPFSIRGHCMIKLSDNTIYVIGGYQRNKAHQRQKRHVSNIECIY